MRIPQSGLKIDSPSWPLLQAHLSYWGITSGDGNLFGTTVACADLANEPNYTRLPIKILSGDAAGQVRVISSDIAGTITVADPFTDVAGVACQITASTRFCILSMLGGGGSPAPPSPSIGLWMFGVCNPGMAASAAILVISNLAGFPDDIFNNEFWCQVIHNANAPATAPEREIRRVTDYVGATGTFTVDAFSANVEANDIIAVFHESIMGMEILSFGTLDTSSVTIPADSTRAAAYPWENDGYFKGCLLMPTEGDCRMQPRPMGDYTSAGGIFALDEPFSQPPGLVDYVIIRSDYPYQRLKEIFDLVNAILMTAETGDTITTTAAEQDMYVNNTPAGVFKPLVLKVNTTNMIAGDSIVVRTYERISPTGALELQSEKQFTGVQHEVLKKILLHPNRHGVETTIQRVGGGDRAYVWEVVYDI